MISSIEILNFLSHEATFLEFTPGVNIIVGPSDSGKSAIIKALKWVIHNRPMGDGMRSSWGGNTSVEITVDDETSVTRFREDNGNGYYVAGLKFSAIKGDVPAEVVKALNLSEINLQTQFDSHFLLSNSSGEVAQYFNKIAHLDRIDTGLQNIQRWSREVQKKLEYNTDALKSSEMRLLAYVSLDSIEKSLLRLEEKETTRERLELALESLVEIIGDIALVEEELQEVAFLKELEESVDKVLDAIACQFELNKELSLLTKIINGIRQVEYNIETIEKGLELEQPITDVLEVIKKQKELKSKLASLTMTLSVFQSLTLEKQEVDKKASSYEKQFHKALGDNSVCPLCGSIINPEK